MPLIVGSSNRDTIQGGADADEIYAGYEYDAVAGGAGNDYIEGNRGDDYLLGEIGSDTYGYYSGDGNDTVLDYGDANDVDRLLFHDLKISDVHFVSNHNDLEIIVNETGHIIKIVNGALGNNTTGLATGGYQGVELFQFSDGTLFDINSVNSVIQNPANFYIAGTQNDDLIFGDGLYKTYDLGAGNDTLHSGAGSDYILAGSGIDSVDVGADEQRDFVYFNIGNERDYIGNFNFSNDVIVFYGFGTEQDILNNSSIYQDGTSAVIEFNNGSDLLIFSHTDVNIVLYNLYNSGTDTFWT
jgi:Ca2+-binding RTX toxin-like protein